MKKTKRTKPTEATTEATSEVNNIISQDTFAIKRETQEIERNVGYFQDVLTAMHEAGFKPTISVFQGIIYAKFRNAKSHMPPNAMEDYLKGETVKATPAINSLPIVDEMKLAMIKLPAGCDNVLNVYAALPNSNDVLKHVFSIDITEDGKVFIPDSIRQKITDKHTVYGDAETMEAIKKAEDIVEQLKALGLRHNRLTIAGETPIISQHPTTGEYSVCRKIIADTVSK